MLHLFLNGIFPVPRASAEREEKENVLPMTVLKMSSKFISYLSFSWKYSGKCVLPKSPGSIQHFDRLSK